MALWAGRKAQFELARLKALALGVESLLTLSNQVLVGFYVSISEPVSLLEINLVLDGHSQHQLVELWANQLSEVLFNCQVAFDAFLN